VRGQLDDIEKTIAKSLLSSLTIFQWKDAIQQTENEQPRLHYGPIAQTIESIFQDNEKDAARYGLWGSDTGPSEVTRTVVKNVKLQRQHKLKTGRS